MIKNTESLLDTRKKCLADDGYALLIDSVHLEAEGKKLKPKQAVELRKMGKEITKEAVESVLTGKEQKKPQSVSVKLPVELYERYFGQMDAGAVQEIMEKALEGYFGKEAPGV